MPFGQTPRSCRATTRYDLLVTRDHGRGRQLRLGRERLSRAATPRGHGPQPQPLGVAFDALGHGRGDRGDGEAGQTARRPARGRQTPIRRWRSVRTFVADPRGASRIAARQGDDAHRLRPRSVSARAGQPPFAATLARETHFHDLGARRPDPDPDQLLLLGRLRSRDPEEDPGRAGRRAAAPAAVRCPPATFARRLVRDAAGKPCRPTRRTAGSAQAAPSSTTRASRSSSTSRSSARRISTSPSPR